MSARGFTLPEILVASSVAVVVAGILAMIFVNNSNLVSHEALTVNQGLGANDASASLRVKLKEAQGVANSYPSTSPEYYSTETTLVLNLPSLDENALPINGSFDTAVYFKDGNKLRLKVFPSTNPVSHRASEDIIVAFNLESILFEYLDKTGLSVDPSQANKVKATISLTEKIGNSEASNTIVVERQLRNF